MKLSIAEKLRRFYDLFSGEDRVLIIINADPDAIASAMAIKRLLWRKAAGVTISSVNIIQRPDNIAMIKLLGVTLIHADDIKEGQFNRFIIVDSQPDHHPSFARFTPLHVIIDHHPVTDFTAAFTDIRPGYGATASILTEYLRAAGIKPSSKLATGLYHAIKNDTSNFERPSLVEDIRAFQFLHHHANIQLARKIEHAEIRPDYLKYFAAALQSKRIHGGRIYAHIGSVKNPDVCVLVADFFMRVHSITWSIVSCICSQKLVIVFRNDGLRKDAGKLAKKAFGSLGSAGGHKSMARAEIPLANLEGVIDHKADSRILKWVINRIERKKSRQAP
jgi:nanoRNase/pAp phosphatase (c-di-AMP/oligoRNAs hydrolase)